MYTRRKEYIYEEIRLLVYYTGGCILRARKHVVAPDWKSSISREQESPFLMEFCLALSQTRRNFLDSLCALMYVYDRNTRS